MSNEQTTKWLTDEYQFPLNLRTPAEVYPLNQRDSQVPVRFAMEISYPRHFGTRNIYFSPFHVAKLKRKYDFGISLRSFINHPKRSQLGFRPNCTWNGSSSTRNR
ncbi:hypothetical protein CEXT_278031 [Caerostris extrusa]|uniref:Uncharacterized protein n=1 Tax=Caerostris extrusa TaxID=172846 RepID=A0AAV4X2Y5_CAEEX|nr:hypothetical protein CEXT_278031 [Caerostris extrusa]